MTSEKDSKSATGAEDTGEIPVEHHEFEEWRKNDSSEWFNRRAYHDLPKGLPKTFKDQWRAAYLIAQEAQPIKSERIVKGVKRLYHKSPTVGQVFQKTLELLMGSLSQRMDDLQVRLNEINRKAAMFSWDMLDNAIKGNLMEFMLSSDDKIRLETTKTAINMMTKLAGSEAKEIFKEAFFSSQGNKLDIKAKMEKIREETAKDERLLGEEEKGH